MQQRSTPSPAGPTHKRWQPPAFSGSETSSPVKVVVDEKVVRKALLVNPALRQGRTTGQIKRTLERGGALGAHVFAAPATVVTAGLAARNLNQRIARFLAGQNDSLQAQMVDLAARRRALDEQENRIKAQAREQLLSFLGVLDGLDGAVENLAALTEQRDFLTRIGLSPASLIEQARKARGR